MWRPFTLGNELAASKTVRQPLFIPIKGLVDGLGVMASSASVVMIFNIAGNVLQPGRCRLNDNNFS